MDESINPRTGYSSKNNVLVPNKAPNPRTALQGKLDLKIQREIEIDGIGMGVLSDGTPFLTGRGLARLCGVDSSRISEMSADWSRDPGPPVPTKVKEILRGRGFSFTQPCIQIQNENGFSSAYPDSVCLAVLEYYAFDAPTLREQARNNFRLLAGHALHDFIYKNVGYDSRSPVPENWRQYHDRISLTYGSVPLGYFSVFKEIAEMIVTLGQSGLNIDSTFIPDGSVGIHWGKHWEDMNLCSTFGKRIKWAHNYPAYFPQARSNPQHPWCYPDVALAEFRRWMRENYVGDGKFDAYITKKVRDKELPASFGHLAIAAYSRRN